MFATDACVWIFALQLRRRVNLSWARLILPKGEHANLAVIASPIIINAEITFISGVTSDEKVAATSYFTWKSDDPPTYISSSFITLNDPLATLGTFATDIDATGQKSSGIT